MKYNVVRAFGLTCLFILAVSATALEPEAVLEPGVPRSDKAFLNDPRHFSFVVMGDRTGGHRPGVFRHAIEQVNWLQPEFVVCVGDLIEGYTGDPATLSQQWNELDAMVDRLEMPFFYTVGNHDFSNPVMQEYWRTHLGKDYYAFTYNNVLFVSLNTEDPPVALPPEIQARQHQLEAAMERDPESTQQRILDISKGRPAAPKLPGSVAISDGQVEWFENTLEAHADIRWTVVLMHKPAWMYASEAFEQIEALLADRPYTVIAGHEHFYHHEKRNGRDYIDMGTTGGVWLRDGPGRFDHVIWVTMTETGPVFANLKLNGILDVTGKSPFDSDTKGAPPVGSK